MGTNLYEYDQNGRLVPRTPSWNQPVEGRNVTARINQQHSPVLPNQRSQQKEQRHAPKLVRMSKAQVLALTHRLKRWLIIASFLSFGTFSGLVAYHQVGTITTQTSSRSIQVTPTTSSSSQVTPTPTTTSTSSQNSNGFLKQQGGNNLGSTQTSQTPTSSSSSTPVSGSGVS